MPFLTPTLLLYPGLGLAGEYQKVIPQAERAEMRMVRWICGVSLREKKTNAELRESMGIEKISDVVRHSRLRWMGHVVEEGGE